MSSTVLEQLRAAQEDIESYERAVVSVLHEKPRNVSGLCPIPSANKPANLDPRMNSIARACFMATK